MELERGRECSYTIAHELKLREEKDLKDTNDGKNELFEADLLKSIVI